MARKAYGRDQQDYFQWETYLAFLEQVVVPAFYRRHHRIYLIQDNASYHKKQETYEWFKANRRYVEVFQLPPYWPELNATERIVNLHGGTGKSVANSVGGSLPGDALLEASGETPEQIAAHPHPFYTPIATFGSDYRLEPVAYGLKFAGLFSGGTLLKPEFSTKLQAVGVNATGHAAKLPGGQTSVIILNKDAITELEVELDFGRGMGGVVETETLQAPALESREAHITTSTKIGSLKQVFRHCFPCNRFTPDGDLSPLRGD